ncbi:type 3 dihydrofolate reductase [Wenzhouxiangella limi]|uniref:Dihydrofolate reductase n=1 Tax=Wenzhouxiangella limi TaxID=2707351 RepID=A0A845V6V7_9GAMM|nr:type 3 dihydrofolate reductase [Wenzhouxiangella limi]NDY95911.1 type 3 dihydrofolate reductase [Wenzhouxiangella limi]
MTAAGPQSSSTTGLTLVAAMARGRVIGRDGTMPWHLPADLRHFKRITLGHPVIMGRRTFESIGRPLPGRTNLVISRSRPQLPPGVCLVGSLEAALAEVAEEHPAMVIGGGQIYAAALPLAERLELTLIDAEVDGDTWFPALRWSDWRVAAVRTRPADERNPHRLNFVSLERKHGPVQP